MNKEGGPPRAACMTELSPLGFNQPLHTDPTPRPEGLVATSALLLDPDSHLMVPPDSSTFSQFLPRPPGWVHVWSSRTRRISFVF